MLVDLLDAKPGILDDERDQGLGELLEILRTPLVAARRASSSNLRARTKRGRKGVNRSLASQLAYLRDESINQSLDSD